MAQAEETTSAVLTCPVKGHHSNPTKPTCEHTDEQKKWKRKLQNRINQRERRARATSSKSQTRPGQVQTHRWRVEEHEVNSVNPDFTTSQAQCPPTSTHLTHHSQTLFPNSVGDFSEELFRLSLSSSSLGSNCLLHLIHFNVVRGLNMNKITLHASAVNISRHSKSPIPIRSDESFYGCFVIKPTLVEGIPNDLIPTHMQLVRAHVTWVNLFPFPEIRDTLIRWQDRFSHREFAEDLFGTDFIATQWFRERKSMKEIPQRKRLVRLKKAAALPDSTDCDDEVTTDRRGLILWGEPHLKQSWEATPGFLNKWTWVVDGCEDLLMSTNRWRRKRGEEQLRLVDIE